MLLTCDSTQHVSVEMFVGRQVGRLNAQQIFDRVCDVVAFAKMRTLPNMALTFTVQPTGVYL